MEFGARRKSLRPLSTLGRDVCGSRVISHEQTALETVASDISAAGARDKPRVGNGIRLSTLIDSSHVWQAPHITNKICEQRRGIVHSPREGQTQRHVQVDHG